MKLYGNCPIQGIDTYQGWLLYFSCRSGVTLDCYEPSKWNKNISLTDAHNEALKTNDFPCLIITYIYRPLLDGYPGWWDHEFATEVYLEALNQFQDKLLNRIDINNET